MTTHTTHHHPDPRFDSPASGRVRRVAWGGILAGLFAIVSLQILLSVLGIAIGLWDFQPAADDDSFATLSMSAGIWWVVTGIVVMFVGGWIAGRTAGFPGGLDGAIHGFAAWSLATVFTFWAAGSAIGAVMSATTTAMTQTVQAAAGWAGDDEAERRAGETRSDRGTDANGSGSALGYDLEALGSDLESVLRDTGAEKLKPENFRDAYQKVTSTARSAARDAAMNPGSARQQLERVLDAFLAQYRDIREAVDREAVVNAITANSDLSESEANKVLDRWQNQYEDAKQQLQQELDSLPTSTAELRQDVRQGYRAAKQSVLRGTGDAAAALSTAGWWVFFSLLAGVIAAAAGGVVGAPKHTLAAEQARR